MSKRRPPSTAKPKARPPRGHVRYARKPRPSKANHPRKRRGATKRELYRGRVEPRAALDHMDVAEGFFAKHDQRMKLGDAFMNEGRDAAKKLGVLLGEAGTDLRLQSVEPPEAADVLADAHHLAFIGRDQLQRYMHELLLDNEDDKVRAIRKRFEFHLALNARSPEAVEAICRALLKGARDDPKTARAADVDGDLLGDIAAAADALAAVRQGKTAALTERTDLAANIAAEHKRLERFLMRYGRKVGKTFRRREDASLRAEGLRAVPRAERGKRKPTAAPAPPAAALVPATAPHA